MVHRNRPVRVRFAPSPTGNLHIGSLRAALFNWLFARHTGGVFIIRIEDTDLERSKQEYVDSILDAFKWVGIESDEPIQYQTQRIDLYRQRIDELVAAGKAYWSDPSQEENGVSVVRFRLPKDRKTVAFDDMVHGEISFDIDQIGGDFVIARSDGSPLYNFVVVVDDIDMDISHVIRGDDHISNTPKQILLYEAFGVVLPQFAHLPMILGPTGAKLSKRDAATSVMEYRDMGIVPDALCNYLVRLGWAHGDQEVFSKQELISAFSLGEVNKSGAIFDMTKLYWMNGVYIKHATAAWLIDYIVSQIDPKFVEHCGGLLRNQIERLVDLYKERTVTLRELVDAIVRLGQAPDIVSVPESEKWGSETALLLDLFIERLAEEKECTHAIIERLVKNICVDRGVSVAALAKPIRYALTGTLSSPSVYELVSIFGRRESIERIARIRGVLP